MHRTQSSKVRQQLQWHTRVNTHTHCEWRSCFFNRAPSRAMPRALRRRGGNLGPDCCDNKQTCFTQSRTQARTRREASSKLKELHMSTSSKAAHKLLHELAGALYDKGFEPGEVSECLELPDPSDPKSAMEFEETPKIAFAWRKRCKDLRVSERHANLMRLRSDFHEPCCLSAVWVKTPDESDRPRSNTERDVQVVLRQGLWSGARGRVTFA